MARKRNVINTVDSDWLTFISRMKSPEEEAAWRAAERRGRGMSGRGGASTQK